MLMRSSRWISRAGFPLWRRFHSRKVPPDLLFSIPVQAIVGPSILALTSDQESIADQLTKSRLDVRNGMGNLLFQQPPFRDAFHRVLGLRVPRDISEHFIGQRAAGIFHAV